MTEFDTMCGDPLEASEEAEPPRGRWSIGIVVGLAVAVLGTSCACAYLLDSRYVRSEDARTSTELVEIAPATLGIVKAVWVTDTQSVKTGEVLVELDDTENLLSLDQAEAELCMVERRAQNRRTNADNSRKESNNLATRETHGASEISNLGKEIDGPPEIAFARAKRDEARLSVERTVLRSPVDGVIAMREVKVGQRVDVGAQLMYVVPLQQMHVEATFRERQLEKVHPGQPVELKTERYGGSVVYHGVVSGFENAQGSAVSTGSLGAWSRWVQRVPVRIALDKNELRARPLQMGLSVYAEIDTEASPGSQSTSKAIAAAMNPVAEARKEGESGGPLTHAASAPADRYKGEKCF